MKILNLILAVLFVVFASVQINDPDPALWILIYGLMAVACILAAFDQYYNGILTILLLAYAAYSIVFISGVLEWLRADDKGMLFDDIAKMQYPYIEETREFLGLFICVLVLGMHLIASLNRRRRLSR